ncbi:-hydroxytryptamine receptor 3A-like [Scomber scombrus]|uniref:-hydroxytryptamine receptor 3A-like n=1 Tax=Scomber scombrus TaxID=13677 RepID=A0AAV1NGF0_SCOSC
MKEANFTESIFICFMLLHGFEAALNCTSPSPESLINALEKELFPKKLIRPVKSFSDPLNLTISITVVGILGVDEKGQTLTIFLWQILEWEIEGLSWDEKKCGAKRVSVPRENLWNPDVQIAEFMDEDNSPQPPYVYIYNNGKVYDDKPIRVVSSCRLGIYTFPFDIQNCSLTFGPYLHFDTDIRMIQGNTAAEILKESQDVIETNGEWKLIDITVDPSSLVLLNANYSQIIYYVVLRRRPTLYVVNLLIPSCFLITVDLFSFMLPPQSVDRSSFKMTLILGYTVFLLIMNDLLPVTGETTPLINVFFSISLALMVASLLETVFITNIQFSSSQYGALPNWLNILVLRYLAVIVCLPPKKKSNRITVSLRQTPPESVNNVSHINSISVKQLHNISDDKPLEKPALDPQQPVLDELKTLSRNLLSIRVQVDKHFQGSETSQEWYMVGIIIDRLLFGLYLIFIIISFVTILCIWTLSNFSTT